MRCPNRECGAKVDEGARVCPQCGTDLKPFVPPGPSEGDNLGTEALPQASPSGRGRKLANASLILAILSCPLFWFAVLYALDLLHQWGLPFVGRLFPRHSSPFLVVLAIVPFLGLAAIVTGHMAIAKGRRVPGTGGVPWRPLFGTVLGYLNIVVPIMLIAFGYFGKWRPSNDRAVCANNLKRMQFMLEEYAADNQGMFPPISSQPGVLMFSTEAIPPKDNGDPLTFTCPTIRYAEKGTAGHKAAHMQTPLYDDQSYLYLGYAVLNDDDVEAFAQAYRRQIAEGGTFDRDLAVGNGKGTDVLRRLSYDVLRPTQMRYSPPPYHSPGAAPTGDVPLLIERDLGHLDPETDDRIRGAFVLYFNSGVRFVERGTWPITDKTQRILAELAE